jgi:uncharacterized SAM-binding protein YcdF (DUF218 family)
MPHGLKRFLWIFLYFHIFVAVALLLTHCSFSHYAKKSFERAQKEKPFDVVIVPGVPYEQENTTSIMTMRILWAKQLYDSGFTKNIIFSGSAVYTPYYEGIVMKIIADSLGIPADHTFFETKAEHSTENIYYSWKMAKEMGFEKIALSTDPFQARVLGGFMKKYTPGVRAIPIVYDRLDIKGKTLPLIDVAPAFAMNFVNIKKREGFWERFAGTLGKRVKREVKEEREAADDKSKVGEN